MNPMSRRPFLVVLSTVFLVQGCSVRTMAVRQTAAVMDHGMSAFETESDAELGRLAMPANLKMVEALLANDPGNPTLLGLLVQGYASFAFLFLEDEEPARAKPVYARAKDFGLRALAARGLTPANPLDVDAWSASLAKARRDDVPALFWTANAWGGLVNLSRDDPMALADLPVPAALAERARALDAAYYHGGPDAFLGFYNAARPKLFGGDPAKAQEHFEAALGRSGGKFLLTKIMMAQTLAVQTQDRALFERLLGEVLAQERGAYPEAELGNEVAKRKARLLLEKIDELF